MTSRTIVIGAGPAGLALTAELMRCGMEAICLESSARAGGMVSTVKRDGFLAETGPHSFRFYTNETPVALKAADVDTRVIDASRDARKRFVTRDGLPVGTPDSLASLLLSPLLDCGGKLRMAREPFIRKRASDTDESVADFVRRRLGDEALVRLVDAVVGGIHAGDPEILSLRHAFPGLHRHENEHGSVLRGLIATGSARRARGPARIVSFPEGMTELPDALAAKLGDALRTKVTVTTIDRTSGGWRVAWRESGEPERIEIADTLVIATPSWRWAGLPLPAGLDPLATAGAAVPHPPVAAVTLGYARDRVAHPLDGFGVLSPAIEERKALGVLFPSSIFPNRAPTGAVTLACFIGGARRPDLCRLPEDELMRLAREECGSLLGASGAPEFFHVTRRVKAIPQYSLNGYTGFLGELVSAEAAFPGLHFLGNHRGGISLVATLDNATALARKITGRTP